MSAQFPLSEAMVASWRRGLGGRAVALDRLRSKGYAAPYCVTGNTIFLVSRHFDIAGGVYWREQLTYHRPAVVGEGLDVEGAVHRVSVHDGRHYTLMSSRSLNAAGEPVCTSLSTGLLRYLRDVVSDESEAVGEDVSPPQPDAEAAAGNPAAPALRALAAGEEIVGKRQQVTLAMMRALAADEGRNPIHTDREAAEHAGLRAPIAGGPHVLAFALEPLMERLHPEVMLHGAHVDVRWVAPVFADAWVEPKVTVRSVDGDRVTLDLLVVADGRTAMVGETVIPLAADA